MKKVLFVAATALSLTTFAQANNSALDESSFEFLPTKSSLSFMSNEKLDELSKSAISSQSQTQKTATEETEATGNATAAKTSGGFLQGVKDWALWGAEKAGRGFMGAAAVAYGTPTAAGLVGTGADMLANAVVTGLTGMPPIGWVAGKAANMLGTAAGYYLAPAPLFAAGYAAPEIVNGVYKAGAAVVNGAVSGANLAADAYKSASNYFYGSAQPAA